MGWQILDYRHWPAICPYRVSLYLFARQEWSATAITDRPTVNMLGGYYSQQQFLRNPDIKTDPASSDKPSVMDEAYKEVHHATCLTGYASRFLVTDGLLQAANGRE